MDHRNGDVEMKVLPPWGLAQHDGETMGRSPLSVADTAAIESCHVLERADTRVRRDEYSTLWFPGLLTACLSYLDGITLLQCELVAHEWYVTIQDPALWAQQYSTTWRRGVPLPAVLLASCRDQLKRICRERRTIPLGLSTRAMWWVHPTTQTLRIHNNSLQREFSRGCVESIRTDHALRPLGVGATVYYYEVTIRGCGSVGILRLSQPNIGHFYGAGSCSHLGWLPGSYGYHGDDGRIYWHDGRAPPGGFAASYGPTWGTLQGALPTDDDHERVTTIGCGVDTARGGSLFFTKNGQFLGMAPMRVAPSRDGLGAAVSLHHLGDTAELNLGRAPFVFDIEQYIAESAAYQEEEKRA